MNKLRRTYPSAIKILFKNNGLFLILVFGGLMFRLFWIVYTNFTEEDALITFRIARNLANGVGFVYNSGEKVMGTTTPLFTLLLGLWAALISKDLFFGARVINLITSISSLFFLFLSLRKIKATRDQQIAVLLIFSFSMKLTRLEVGGMETSFVIFLLITSWYLYLSRHLFWTSILLGLLVLTRLDLFMWPVSMLIIEMISRPKKSFQMGVIILIVVLPWVVFSTIYFGSPIPHTVDAKWVAYINNNQSSFLLHLMAIVNFLSPFDQYKDHILLRNILAWMTLIIAAWQSVYELRENKITLIVIFILLDISRLVFTRATFLNRYFAPLLVAILILFGLGIGRLWELSRFYSFRMKSLFFITIIILGVTGLIFGGFASNKTKIGQEYRHDKSLKMIGCWLNRYSPPSATILLEPLGYVGYYSDRHMIDEVGLVSPEIVALKKLGVSADEYFLLFKPDYYVLHCDDAIRLQNENREVGLGLDDHYTIQVTYNPLNFDIKYPDNSRISGLQRNSCYEVWQIISE